MAATKGLAVEQVAIDRLHLNPANPRRNDEAVPHVAASLRRFGWQQPVVARPSGEVIAGNTRLKAARSLGLTEVPVVWFDGPDIEAIAYGIADNRAHEFSAWSEPDLARLLTELRAELRAEDALDGVGYTTDDVDALLADLAAETDGAGKTLCAAMEGVAAAMAPARRSYGWVVAPTYDLCDKVFREIVMVAAEHLRHRILSLKENERKLLLRNMAGGISEIRGKSADNPVSLLGEGLDWVVVDEAARLKPTIWEGHLSQRLIDRDGWALLISTPRGKGWFYSLYQRGQGDDPTYASWNWPSWANPHLERRAHRSRARAAPGAGVSPGVRGGVPGRRWPGLPLRPRECNGRLAAAAAP